MKYVNDFLRACEVSSRDTQEQFKRLLDCVEKEISQGIHLQVGSAFGILHSLAEKDVCGSYFEFISQDILIRDNKQMSLRLIVFPSVFKPEKWSDTFYKGLLRYPVSEFSDRSIVELGTGCGWISLALLFRSEVKTIVGVDINPRAIIAARINKILNLFDSKGNFRLSAGGKRLYDIIDFSESDLLLAVPEKSKPVDRVIGCIPQVLRPEVIQPELLRSSEVSDELLYSLSNYCGRQGYLEDQFGLGLIAKAIEQSVSMLKPTGKMILNLGGRPGIENLRHMMLRRGLSVEQKWQAKVCQTDDTDISGLELIERTSPHRFEFYNSATTDVSISASTARRLLSRGGSIFHSVVVFESSLEYPVYLKRIFKVIEKPRFDRVRTYLDMTCQDNEVAEERYSFFASLCEFIDEAHNLPYDKTQGKSSLRAGLAQYLNSYYGLSVALENVLVFPSRAHFIHNLVRIAAPDDVMIDLERAQEFRDDEFFHGRLIEIPRSHSVTRELLLRLKPKMVVYAVNALDIHSDSVPYSLIEVTEQIGALLLLDISDTFKLSSTPPSYEFFDCFRTQGFAAHVFLLIDLIGNRVYPDMSLCTIIGSNSGLLDQLVKSIEVTHSRTPLLTQMLYDNLLHDLTFFQDSSLHYSNSKTHLSSSLSRSSHPLLTHAAHDEAERAFSDSALRLDYGENELPMSEEIKSIILESFAAETRGVDELSLDSEISKYLNNSIGITDTSSYSILYGFGVAPLFSSVMSYCSSHNHKVYYPKGSYGYFKATMLFYGVEAICLETSESSRFLLNPEMLLASLPVDGKTFFLYLNAPLSNPTGGVYGRNTIRKIAEIVESRKGYLIVDTIFAGLEFEEPCLGPHDLLELQNVILLGGVSKLFSSAGLRFGYAAVGSSDLAESLRVRIYDSLDSHCMSIAGRIFGLLNTQDQKLTHWCAQQRKTLKKRSLELGDLLQANGWNVIVPDGGLFLCATPLWLPDSIDAKGDVASEILYNEANILVNGGTYIDIPDYCRFVLSVKESVWQEIFKRIKLLDMEEIKREYCEK